jgi:hypothetical protein
MRIELDRWRLESRPELGLLNKLSDMLRAEGERRPNRLPDLSSCEWLFAGSDYSGQHADAPYEAYTIMLADLARCADWEKARRSVRSRWLADGRRVSYKTLRDRQQERALLPLLEAADSIPGLLLTVLVDRDIENLFRLTEEERTEENLGIFVGWPRGSLEKLLRVVHLLSLMVAGLSRAGQNLVWITDEDEIAANESRLNELVIAFSNVASHYLPHTLGHLRVGTTDSDTGSRDLEDLVTVADLASGAAADSLGRYRGVRGWPAAPGILVPAAAGTPGKATMIMSWYARDDAAKLKRFIYLIDQDAESGKRRVSALRIRPSGLVA